MSRSFQHCGGGHAGILSTGTWGDPMGCPCDRAEREVSRRGAMCVRHVSFQCVALMAGNDSVVPPLRTGAENRRTGRSSMKVGLVGFAGSGKTTVFNTLTGL